jgi:chemotaxis protein histidine kinase CheA
MPPAIQNPSLTTERGREAAERRLHQRRERFLASASALVAGFRALAVALTAAPAHAGAIETLWREAHRIHGAASSHGCVGASRLAGTFERRVRAWVRDPALERAERAAVVERFTDALALALVDDARQGGAPR